MNKKIVTQFYQEFYVNQDLEAAAKYVSEDHKLVRACVYVVNAATVCSVSVRTTASEDSSGRTSTRSSLGLGVFGVCPGPK